MAETASALNIEPTHILTGHVLSDFPDHATFRNRKETVERWTNLGYLSLTQFERAIFD